MPTYKLYYFTIGFVMSLAKPHKAKQQVTSMNGTRYFFSIAFIS